ncbi:MAG: glutamate--cysteine ligase [Methylococcaceae bacterium]|nr:glutamate--cysteine ligase [Methylococcaceae bacterium]
MGQEIDHIRFSEQEYAEFHRRLALETRLLEHWHDFGGFAPGPRMAGFELEAWLVDAEMQPVPANERFLKALDDELAGPELARFNIEFNTPPVPLRGDGLRRAQAELEGHWHHAQVKAEELGYRLLLIGILPTLDDRLLNLANLSALNRYRALNDQILAARAGRPIRLDIVGRQHLRCWHRDVMLEAATTSFQLHRQLDPQWAERHFNAALMASAAVVGAGANSPYLFGRDLWAETRIPLFEQAVDIGGYRAAVQGPLRRVGFGSDYARHSLTELFRENLDHYPVILPILFETPAERLSHLRLHNGTVWRWNRPLVAFGDDGSPHYRVENRVLPAGPTFADMFANAALYHGLTEFLSGEPSPLPFPQARDNFYQAARLGLAAHVVWSDGDKHRLRSLLLKRLLPQAERGLRQLEIDECDIDRYLGLVEARIAQERTGADWQRRFLAKYPGCFQAMTRDYYTHHCSGIPVHQWPDD